MPKHPHLEEFMRRMEPHSIAIIPSAREAVRSHDTNYRYRQSSDFYYLTGFDEPEAIAVVRPGYAEGAYTLFVRPRDAEKEAWDGARAGVEGAKDVHGADAAFPVAEFNQKLGDLLGGTGNLYYRLGYDRDLDDQLIRKLSEMRGLTRRGVVAPVTITDLSHVLHEMRRIKSDEEIKLIERAVEITAEAHVEAMRVVKPGMKEYEIEALIEYIFRRHGAAAPAYGSIVGAGNNATVLHYVKNDATLQEGDLLLVDAGAEYKGYAADITRTFPVSGKFTDAHRDIYELVLKAEETCVAEARAGVSMDDLYNRSAEILTEGMVRLGLLEGDSQKLIEEGAHKKFYMHKLGHFLGMDVHDVGLYYQEGKARPLQPGMIVTIEPGLYITKDTEGVPDKYRGIGVRIEDDVLITEEGNRVLTGGVPKAVEEIEALMAR
jgi:Xaa-Pro aminopeptidase